jgi:glycosyltransferase involved in cell wall biosynthesis
MKEQGKILVVSFQSLTAKSGGGMAKLGYYVSEQLHKRGLLKKFIVSSKGKYETSFPSAAVSGLSRYYLFLLNKLNRFIKLPDYRFRLIQEHLFDIQCCAHITPDIDILFTTNAHLKRTYSKAKKMGIKIIYVPANHEENYIYKIVSEENKKLGINRPEPYTYQPRIKFYNDSIVYVDTVLCTYPTVYESYADTGRKHEVIKINGHLKPDFKPYEYREKPARETYDVIYIATTVPLKGLQYLLEAWKELMSQSGHDNLRLHIIGRIDGALKDYFDTHFKGLKNVQYLGRVEDINTILENQHLCVIPSLTDAGPYVALEAAHYGVPVVLTENCGSAELLSRKPGGCKVIPMRDTEAIRDAIIWAYHNRQEAIQMGKTGKELLDGYSMEAFIINVTDYLEQTLAAHNK